MDPYWGGYGGYGGYGDFNTGYGYGYGFNPGMYNDPYNGYGYGQGYDYGGYRNSYGNAYDDRFNPRSRNASVPGGGFVIGSEPSSSSHHPDLNRLSRGPLYGYTGQGGRLYSRNGNPLTGRIHFAGDEEPRRKFGPVRRNRDPSWWHGGPESGWISRHDFDPGDGCPVM